MAAKPLTSEAIAITEKKMDMTLEDIIKMSKSNPSKAKKHRMPNKSQTFLNKGALDKSFKVRQFMDSRSTLRQGALAQRRSNFQRNQFPLATEAARKAVVAPTHSRMFTQGRMMNVNKNANKPRVVTPVQRRAANGGFGAKQQQQSKLMSKQQQQQQQQQQRPQTLDSLFANMKEERMRALSQQNNNGGRRNEGGNQRRQQWPRGGFRFGN